MRIAFALYSLLTVMTVFQFSSCGVISAAERPNILFILTEDQGAQMGCLGTAGLKTPNMDAIARSGVLFRNGFVNYPVCSATKASIYTGVYNHANGLLNNTNNFHKPVSEVTAEERQMPIYSRNQIRPELPTLTELLHEAGYYQAVTSKLHVAPVEKFPYDEYIRGNGCEEFAGFVQRAKKISKPWFYLNNIPNPHRPFSNSDQQSIRVNSADVEIPAFLPDTPVVRKDWAEYLAAIEEADELIGITLKSLRDSGADENTIVIFLGDHGPTFQHGKMTLHDLGLRVPFAIRIPGGASGVETDALATGVDLMPTLLDLVGIEMPKSVQGVSLVPILKGTSDAVRKYAFAEISDLGPLPNDGMQERAVFDGRWKLIYREKTETRWRQVQADTKFWEKWRNRTYDETVRVKNQFPEQFRILQEQDPQSLDGIVPVFELYDLKSDPDEMNNLAGDDSAQQQLRRLYAVLKDWGQSTGETAVAYEKAIP